MHHRAAGAAADRVGLHLDAESPLDRFPPSKFSPVPNQLAENFAIRAIEAQPLDYAKAVFNDTWRVFAWKRVRSSRTLRRTTSTSSATTRCPIPNWDKADLGPYDSYAAAYVHGNPMTQVVVAVRQRHPRLPAVRMAAGHRCTG